MLYSVAGGESLALGRAADEALCSGLGAMHVHVAFVPLWFWRSMAGLAYVVSVLLLLGVEFFGSIGMGAKRWLEIGPLRLQPSELAKITSIMMRWPPIMTGLISARPRIRYGLVAVLIVLVPALLVLRQPDLGTALLILGWGGCGDVRRRGQPVVFRRGYRGGAGW
jgi:rod shape determining protein RodA